MADGGVREIPLTKGYAALVDAADFDWLSQWKWCYRPSRATGYAYRSVYGADRKYHSVHMHRVLLDAPRDRQVDHINGNGLDNRRENLRLATRAQNQVNKRPRSRTGYKGVFPARHRFRASITTDGIKFDLGTFATAVEAARAYDAAARRIHGDFAHLNLPEGA